MKAPNPAIRRVMPPLHKTACLEPVDKPADGDRLDLDERGKLVLRHAGLTLESNKDHPLRAGHAVGAGKRIGARPHQPGHIGENTQRIAIKGLFHSVREYKPRYDIDKRASGSSTGKIEKIS